MNITELLAPVLTDGIRVNNFFNGRVLTAEDLRAEQQANRAQHRQLAQAIGEGVVHGLEVSARTADDGTPLLHVTRGLALNRDGDAVALGRHVRVRLVPAREAAAAEAGLFAVCQPRASSLDLTNVGLYVLSASPASALSSERAPSVEFGSEGVASACASRWAQEGARFSVAPLPLVPAGSTTTALATELAGLAEAVETDVERVLRGGASDTPAVRMRLRRNLSRLRNGAAYLCFGADTGAVRRANPLPAGPGFPTPAYGAVDGMRERGELTSCEVPLALFHLSRRGIEWVDAWAVRRVPVPALTAGTLDVLPGRRPAAEAVAMVLQFQQQITELLGSELTTAQLAGLEAREYFRFLPPTGLVPLRPAGTGRGFDHTAFFRALAAGGPVLFSGARLRRLLAEGMLHAPLDLATSPVVQLWRIDDNLPGAGSNPPPYVVFLAHRTLLPLVRVLEVDPEIFLRNGAELRSHLLARGLHILLGQPIDPLTATSAACFVTLELPFPSSPPDRELWGDALIGFQPLVLAGRVETDGIGGLYWYPAEATATLLRRGLPVGVGGRTGLPFRDEWEVFDPPGSAASRWEYADGGSVVQLSPGAGAGLPSVADDLGTVALARQRLQENAFTLDLSASVPSYGGNAPRSLGLVFNWTSAGRYHVFFCRYHWVPVGFSGAFARTTLGVMEVLGGRVRVLDTRQIAVAQSTPRDINLVIKQQGGSLLFSGQVTLHGGAELPQVSFGVPAAPRQLMRDSGVGLTTRYTAPVEFSRLEVVYPGPSERVVLVPPLASQRVLGRLTLKRAFLEPLATEAPAGPAQSDSATAATSQTDLELWFWLTGPAPSYGYGYGDSGGTPGIGVGRIPIGGGFT
jgi:hypothetical protein